MGIADVVESAVGAAFDFIGDDLTSATLTHFEQEDPEYDTATGTLIDPYDTHDVEIFRSNWTQAEVMSFDIKKGDAKFLLPASQISFVPTERDYFTIDEAKWVIMSFRRTPFGKLFIVQAQKI